MMNSLLLLTAFATGLVSIAWVGAGFWGASWLALAMTAGIAGVYLLGALELRRFRVATHALAQALANIPQPLPSLGEWLGGLPPSLRHVVRSRIEGERLVFPGPALTPYLVGLLVMLGMLGTFLGMVVTFQGAVFALEGSADLQAVRSALAAPIKGLGLAFGTSVAGVAASAMLGLVSAICRRERADVARQLDACIASVFRPFSLVQQRQETYQALQMQARALPDVAAGLQAMMDGMERRSQQLDAQLNDRQAQFHRDVTLAYSGLASAVEKSLHDSLTASAQAAGASLVPVVEAAMVAIAQESRHLHAQVREATHMQLEGLSNRFNHTASAVADTWLASLDQQGRSNERLVQGLDRALAQFTDTFEQRFGALIRSRTDSEALWTREHAERMDQLAGLWRTELGALRDAEAVRGRAAVERLGELQSVVTDHLATLGAALEAPLTRLLQTASEVPLAAAQMLAQLKQEMTSLTERDNRALGNHTELLDRVGSVLKTIEQASIAQRTAITSLVESAAVVLHGAGNRFSETLDAQAGRVQDLSAHVSASAIELSSLGASFNHGVQLFSDSNAKLVERLQGLESVLGQSITRSDEQLAYYVAQAREVIELSISAQQGIIEDLHRLAGRQTAPAEADA